MPYASTYHC